MTFVRPGDQPVVLRFLLEFLFADLLGLDQVKYPLNQLPVIDFHLFCKLLLNSDRPQDLLGVLRARWHKHVHQDVVGGLATSLSDDFISGFDSGFWTYFTAFPIHFFRRVTRILLGACDLLAVLDTVPAGAQDAGQEPIEPEDGVPHFSMGVGLPIVNTGFLVLLFQDDLHSGATSPLGFEAPGDELQ